MIPKLLPICRNVIPFFLHATISFILTAFLFINCLPISANSSVDPINLSIDEKASDIPNDCTLNVDKSGGNSLVEGDGWETAIYRWLAQSKTATTRNTPKLHIKQPVIERPVIQKLP